MQSSGQPQSVSGSGGPSESASGGAVAGRAAGGSGAQPTGRAGTSASAPSSQAPGDAKPGDGLANEAGAAGSPTAGPSGGAPSDGTAGDGAGPATAAAGTGGVMAAAEPGALSDMQTLIPDASWTCGMPEGIPGPGTGELVFEIDFTVGDVHELGETQFGHRTQIDVTGGTVQGTKLDATVMDRGLDYQLTLANGVVELEQIHILRAGSASVLMRNCGLAPDAAGPTRVVLDFEAPNASAVAWLNMGTYIGVREFSASSKSLKMKVYEVAAAASAMDAVQIPAAPEGPHNTWECAVSSRTRGAEVYRETVGIGGSVSVGESKRGNRNIIPITGGTTSGRVPGTVLSGGADFQIIANGSFEEIDARYSVRTDEGDIIIVRNCGPLGGLVPVFETAKDGKYAWLNENNWQSSNPGLGIGAVNLTIYETR